MNHLGAMILEVFNHLGAMISEVNYTFTVSCSPFSKWHVRLLVVVVVAVVMALVVVVGVVVAVVVFARVGCVLVRVDGAHCFSFARCRHL